MREMPPGDGSSNLPVDVSPEFVEEIGRVLNVTPQTETLPSQRPPVDVLERSAR
jgi:hypothetical protein